MALDIKTVCGGPVDVNTYVVAKENGNDCVLIDPGAETAAVKAAVGERNVTAVLLTHAHYDHIFHMQPWLQQGAKLYAHRLEIPVLGSPELNLSAMFGDTPLRMPSPDVVLEDGDTFEEAGISFTVLHTPGHTQGSVCYLTGKTLFSGDTMFYASYGRVDFPGGSAAQMRKSLDKLCKLDGETIVYPGHDRKTKIAWERGRPA